jgi:hypothetical protein
MFQIVEEYMPHVSKQEYMPLAHYYAKQEHRKKLRDIHQELTDRRMKVIYDEWTVVGVTL